MKLNRRRSNRNIIIGLKRIYREQRIQNRKRGKLKFENDIRVRAKLDGRFERKIINTRLPYKLAPKPEYSATIKFLASKGNVFSKNKYKNLKNGVFTMPQIFSLSDNYVESLSFLSTLFAVLYNESEENVIFDYSKCERIDPDASVCMDIILRDFIKYYKACRHLKHHIRIETITPQNFSNDAVRKVLFSIGSFRMLNGVELKFEDIVPLKLCAANRLNDRASAMREQDITEMVDYVISSLARMGKVLTWEKEANLFNVIGEVLINAEEHASEQYRYSAGYFQEINDDGNHYGVFNLVIFNLGKTIYEQFSENNCPNKLVVEQMKRLSEQFTSKRLFRSAQFEEETLWTLYALQEGVTSKADQNRGNGSIRFIESFFDLKGNDQKDDLSSLTIMSGNTRIVFNGAYRTHEIIKGNPPKSFKMMTFNKNNDIQELPDENFVIFAENFFPGTLISAKICINEDDIDSTTTDVIKK